MSFFKIKNIEDIDEFLKNVSEEELKCPCGKGIINVEITDIVGYKNKIITVCCDKCRKELEEEKNE